MCFAKHMKCIHMMTLGFKGLKLDWINYVIVQYCKILMCMILEHSCREPEVVVKCCMISFSNLVLL